MATNAAFSQSVFTDSLEFTTSGESFWGPQSGEREELSFREVKTDIDESGQFGEFIGVEVASTYATLEGSTQFICPAGTFPDVFDGTDNCYSCPDGYAQNPLFPANDERVCFKLSDFTTADEQGPAQFICPAGQFPDALLQNCYSCPSGTSHDPLIPAQLPGACKTNTIAFRENGNALFCDSGDFPNGSLSACYDCNSGYTHNPLLGVNTTGVCWDSSWEQDCWDTFLGEVCGIPYLEFSYKTANYRNDLGCDAGEFGGGVINPNGCYSCPSGTTHNPVLPINTPGVCFANAMASQEEPTTFICNSDEFLDTETGACFSCPTDYSHNPALFASTPGVCFKRDETVAQEEGTTGFICPVGQFLDVVSGECYSCPDNYDWNPLVPVGQEGSCVDWGSLEVGDPDNPDFEVGFNIHYDIKYIDGIEGGLTTDPGSVDIDFKPSVTVEITPKASDDGNEHLTIKTTQSITEEDFSMSTIWPRVDMFYDTFKEEDYLVTGEFRGVAFDFDEFRWKQSSTTETMFDVSTNGERHINEDEPLLHFGIGASGLDLAVVGKGISNYTGGLDPGVELTHTFFAESVPGVPTGGTPIVEFGVTGPKMNTPPEKTSDILDREINYKASFNEEYALGANASNTYIEHSIIASDRSGARLGVLGGSAQETDLMRLDLDLDGVASLLLSGGANALGYKVSVPTGIPLVNYWSLSASLLDADAASILSIHENLKFHPRLETIFHFSKRVLVEATPGEGYVLLSDIRAPVGEEIEIIHPGGDLTVSTRYSLDNNEFESDVDLVLTPLFEMEILSAEMRVLGVPKALLPKQTAIKLTQEVVPDPIKIADMNFEIGSYLHWQIRNGSELLGLSESEKRARYEEEKDVAKFSLAGFSDATGGSVTVSGTNDQPVARCQDSSVSLGPLGMASILVSDIDAGSSDFDGGALASLSLSQSQFSCEDFGTQLVTLSVLDNAGAEASCQSIVNVTDSLMPVGALPENIVLEEGEVYHFDVDVTDNCGNIDFDWVFPNGRLSNAPAPTHQFCILGDQQIAFQADDGLGNTRAESISVNVANKPPVSDAGLELNGFEGQALSLDAAKFSDTGLFGHQVWIDWGDGTGLEPYALTDPETGDQCLVDMQVDAAHIYIQDGNYTITLRTQDVAGAIHEDTTVAHIANREPEITELTPTARTEMLGQPASLFLYSGESLGFEIKYSDEGEADRHRLTVDWQEQGVAPSIYDLGMSSGKEGVFTQQKTFFKPGNYSIKFTLEDEAGGQVSQEIWLQVIPLSVQMDFMSTDDENLVEASLTGPVRVTLFGGEHELGPYSVNNIDLESLKLGSGEAEALHKKYDLLLLQISGGVITQYADFNNDSILDVKLWFDAKEAGIAQESRSITLTGTLNDGRYFEANDRVNVAASRASYLRMMPAILMLLEE